MDPLTIGLITGGTNLLGSIFSSFTAKDNAQQQMQNQKALQLDSELFNRQEAETNRAFQASQIGQQREYQTQMSNTAYQRSRADMMAAGLNPAAMFGSAGAASTPTGGAASGSAASVGTPSAPMPQTTHPLAGIGEAIGKGVQSMVTAKTVDKMGEEISNLQAENAAIKARTEKTIAEAVTERKRPAQITAQTVTETKRPAQVEAQTDTERERREQVLAQGLRDLGELRLKQLQVPGAEFSARQSREKSKALSDETIKTLEGGSYIGGKVNDAIAPVISAAKALYHMIRR